jgi:hypothetical protein
MFVAVYEEKMIFNRAIFPTGCATRCALGSRSFIGRSTLVLFPGEGSEIPPPSGSRSAKKNAVKSDYR